jgi:hypothetical protein
LRHRKCSWPSRLADEMPIPTSTSHPCPACGSVFSSLKYRDLHLHHRRDCMATYQQLTRSSSPPALNVRLTGGPFGQHNDAEDMAEDSNFGDKPDTSSLPTDRANAESTGSNDDSDQLASVMSEDQMNPMASRNVSSMDPHWFEHLPQVARLNS